MKHLMLLLVCCTLLACGSTTSVTRVYAGADGKPVTETLTGNAATYGLYVEGTLRVTEANLRPAAASDDQDCPPGDSTCVVAREAFRALRALAGAQAGNALQAPPRERDNAEKFRDIMAGAALVAVPGINAWERARSSDNMVEITQSNNDAQVALYESAFGFGSVAVENAGPRINVGGNLGDTFGDDATGRDRIETTTTTNIGRDQTGGDHIDNSHNGAPCTVTTGAATGTTGTVGSDGQCQAGNGG